MDSLFIFQKIVEKKLLGKIFSMLYTVTDFWFWKNILRLRDNHSKEMSVKPSVFGVISVYFSRLRDICLIGKQALLWVDSVIKSLSSMRRDWELAIRSNKKLQMLENIFSLE